MLSGSSSGSHERIRTLESVRHEGRGGDRCTSVAGWPGAEASIRTLESVRHEGTGAASARDWLRLRALTRRFPSTHPQTVPVPVAPLRLVRPTTNVLPLRAPQRKNSIRSVEADRPASSGCPAFAVRPSRGEPRTGLTGRMVDFSRATDRCERVGNVRRQAGSWSPARRPLATVWHGGTNRPTRPQGHLVPDGRDRGLCRVRALRPCRRWERASERSASTRSLTILDRGRAAARCPVERSGQRQLGRTSRAGRRAGQTETATGGTARRPLGAVARWPPSQPPAWRDSDRTR